MECCLQALRVRAMSGNTLQGASLAPLKQGQRIDLLLACAGTFHRGLRQEVGPIRKCDTESVWRKVHSVRIKDAFLPESEQSSHHCSAAASQLRYNSNIGLIGDVVDANNCQEKRNPQFQHLQIGVDQLPNLSRGSFD